MLSSLLAKFKESKPEEDLQKTKVSEKTESAEAFLKTHDARQFIQEWSRKKDSGGEKLYTKRGITSLLHILHATPALDSDKKVLKKADGLLKELKGKDGLEGFIRGLKAKSEGIMKGFKKAA